MHPPSRATVRIYCTQVGGLDVGDNDCWPTTSTVSLTKAVDSARGSHTVPVLDLPKGTREQGSSPRATSVSQVPRQHIRLSLCFTNIEYELTAELLQHGLLLGKLGAQNRDEADHGNPPVNALQQVAEANTKSGFVGTRQKAWT